MRVSDEGKSLTIQWERIKASPVDLEPWMELLSIYMEQGLWFPATYVARRLNLIDSSLSGYIDKQGLPAWRSESSELEALLQTGGAKADAIRIQVLAWLANNPKDWLCWVYLAGLVELNGGDVDAKDNALEQACSLEYLDGETKHLMGLWCLKVGRADIAVGYLGQLVDVRPMRYGSMLHLGLALMMLSNVPAAEKAFTRASMSNSPPFLVLLAERIYEHNYWEQAIEVLKKAIALDSSNSQIRIRLAQLQSDVYMLGDCSATLQEVASLDPGNLDAKKISAGLSGKIGDAHLYLRQLEEEYFLEGGESSSRLISSIAMTMLYQDDLEPQVVADRHTSMCAKLGDIAQPLEAYKNNQKRPLRVGYVTGDLHRQHPVCIFMLPLLRELKNFNLETYIYHTGSMHDQYTQAAKDSVNRWVSAAHHDDAALHKVIRGDQIDVLIDLAGHTSTHRLGVFAMRSAPMQVSYLGYPHSTGLPQMDYLIGDDVVSPSKHRSLFSESLLNMPNSVFCWSPVDSYPLPIARAIDLPVTFGSFNNAIKLTPKTILLWSKVLHAVPGSRLLLKAPALLDSSASGRVKALFVENGIDLERIECRGPSELSVMMQEYGGVDIALDPVTYNGGTTSLQALWMGVPLITLMGRSFQSRMGASFLTALGESRWIAHDEDDYVKIAISMAGDIKAIRNGRAQLRKKMTQSSLCNIKKFAKDYEAILQKAFARHTKKHA